ncbi:MAG: helix-turn-helix transcriptional regulator [Sphingobium sp.]
MTTYTDTLYSYDDITKIAKVTRKTIWKWAREGKFPKPRKCNGMVRWRASDVDAWVAAL